MFKKINEYFLEFQRKNQLRFSALKQSKFLHSQEKKKEALNIKNNVLKYERDLSRIRYSNEINLTKMISDMRFFNETRWERFKISLASRFKGLNFCWVMVYLSDNRNLLRRFPMPRPFIVDISSTWYLFSPTSFRYVNGEPLLEFYDGNPFAVLHNVKAKVSSIDANAFTAVQRSKFVIDATDTGVQDNGNLLVIIGLVISVLSFIASIVVIVMISKIKTGAVV